MKTKLLIFVCIVSSVGTFAQEKNSFVPNIFGIEKSVDSLPSFVYTKDELDSFLIHNSIIPIQYDRSMSVHVYGSFFVDSLSKPFNINISNVDVKLTEVLFEKNDMDSLTAYYAKESKRLITLTKDLWIVNSTNSKKQLNIIIPFVSESYEQKRQEALRSHAKTYYAETKKDDKYYKNLERAKKTYKINDYYDYGVKKLNENKLLLAKKYFEQAIQVKSDDLDAYYNLGICYLKLNDSIHACKCWEMGQKLGDTGVLNLITKYCK